MQKLCRDFSRKLIHSRWIFDELLISNPHEFIPRNPCRIIRVSLNLDELVRVSMKFWQIRCSKFLQVLLEFFFNFYFEILKKTSNEFNCYFSFSFLFFFFFTRYFCTRKHNEGSRRELPFKIQIESNTN